MNNNRKLLLVLLWILMAAMNLLAGAWGWDIQFAGLTVLSFLLFYYIRNESWLLRLIFLLPALVYGVAGINANFHVLPIKLIPFVFFCIFILYKREINIKYIWALSILLAWPAYLFMLFYLNWFFNKHFEDKKEAAFTYPMYNQQGLDITQEILKASKDSLIVLNCWSVNCGSCIRKYPEFIKLAEAYKHTKTKFYNLNLPLTIAAQRKMNHMMNLYFTPGVNIRVHQNAIWKDLAIDGVPLFIILKDSKIHYIGHLPVYAPAYEKSLEALLSSAVE